MKRAYYLCRDVYCCQIDEGVVFLRLATNKYLAVSSSYVAAMRHNVLGWPGSTSRDEPCVDTTQQLSELVAAGLLTTDASNGKPYAALPPLADRCLAPRKRSELSTRVRITDVLRLLNAYRRALRCMRRGDLSAVVARLEALPTPENWDVRSGETGRRSQDLVNLFLRLRPWLYSPRNQCLLDSITLVNLLMDAGIKPMLILGINTKPFSAHAWTQIGSSVLNDIPEHVQEYTPVLAA